MHLNELKNENNNRPMSFSSDTNEKNAIDEDSNIGIAEDQTLQCEQHHNSRDPTAGSSVVVVLVNSNRGAVGCASSVSSNNSDENCWLGMLPEFLDPGIEAVDR